MQHSSTIQIVDDDLNLCRSLAMVLGKHGYHAEIHGTAQALLDARGREPECVISDIAMPGMNGLQLMQAMRATGRMVPFIFMTGTGNVTMAVRAIKLGAVDCLVKPFALRNILAALAEAKTRHPPAGGLVDGLSKRESEVLQGLVDGETNKQIARTLGLSPRTVEAYRAHVMQKMHATNLPQLVRASLLARL